LWQSGTSEQKHISEQGLISGDRRRETEKERERKRKEWGPVPHNLFRGPAPPVT
jgi:hypothetical protein